MAEQTSCLKPGRVNSFVRIPPPMVSAPSTINVENPCRCKVIAAANPFGPEPIIIASYFFIVLLSYLLSANIKTYRIKPSETTFLLSDNLKPNNNLYLINSEHSNLAKYH